MAGKVGDVQGVTGGFGFKLFDDKGGTQRLTLAFETQAEATAARRLVVKAFAKTKSATAPGR
jgi:hypothetical protein